MEVETLSLAWDQFQISATDMFKGLLQNRNFSDVTLVCDDNKQLKAHRVVLSACSQWFGDVLEQVAFHPSPLLYLRGVKTDQLEAVLKFIYKGEVEVGRDKLEDFMGIARDLRIRGLVEEQEKNRKNKETEELSYGGEHEIELSREKLKKKEQLQNSKELKGHTVPQNVNNNPSKAKTNTVTSKWEVMEQKIKENLKRKEKQLEVIVDNKENKLENSSDTNEETTGKHANYIKGEQESKQDTYFSARKLQQDLVPQLDSMELVDSGTDLIAQSEAIKLIEEMKKKYLSNSASKDRTKKPGHEQGKPSVKNEMERKIEEEMNKIHDVSLRTDAESVSDEKIKEADDSDEATINSLMERASVKDIKADESGDYSCTNCHYKSSNHRNLTRHFQIHTSNFQCSVCNKTFSNRGNVRRHEVSAHDSISEGDGNLVTIGTTPKDMKDGDVNDMEIDKLENSQDNDDDFDDDYEKNSRSSNSFNVAWCSTCDKSFSSIQNMNRHKRNIHDGVRFECSQCDESFTQSWLLKNHVKMKHE